MKNLIMMVLAVGALAAGPALAGFNETFTFQQGDANGYSGTEDTILRWGADPGPGNRDIGFEEGAWWDIGFGSAPNGVSGGSSGPRQSVGVMRFNDVFGGGANQIPLLSTVSNVVSAELMIRVNQQNGDTLRASPFFTTLSTYGVANETIANNGEPTGHYQAHNNDPGQAVDWAVPCTLTSEHCGPIDAQLGLGAADYDSGDAAVGSGIEGAVLPQRIDIDVTALVRGGYLTNDPITGAQGNGVILDNPNLTELTLLLSEWEPIFRPMLTVTIIPEPATFGLLGLGCVLIGLRRR